MHGSKFDAVLLLRYTSNAGWSSLVARRAHNPKVVSSNLTPATNLTYSPGLVGLHQQALLLFGKDFFPCALPYSKDCRSWELQIQRVNFLDTHIPHDEWRVVKVQTVPRVARLKHINTGNILKPEDALTL